MAIYSKGGYVDPFKKKKSVNEMIKTTKLPAATAAPVVKPTTAAQPSTGFNPTAQKGSTMEKAVKDFSGIPTVTDTVGQMTNPADLYGETGKTAMDSLNEWLKSSGLAPDQSQKFMDMAAQLIGQGPAAVAKPGDIGAPTDYAKPNITAPTVAGVDPQYAGNSVAGNFVTDAVGPDGSPISDVTNDLKGSSIPGLNELIAMLQGEQVPGFEELTKLANQTGIPGLDEMIAKIGANDPTKASGFENSELFGNPNSVANRSFELGLSGADQALKADWDKELFDKGAKAIQDQLAAGRTASGIKAGRDVNNMGQVYVPGTSISDEAMAVHYSPLLAESERLMQELGERNTDRALEQKRFGTESAINLGGESSRAAQGNAGLLTGENEFTQGLDAEKRKSIVDLLKMIQSGDQQAGSNVIDIAKLVQGGNIAKGDQIIDAAGTVQTGDLGEDQMAIQIKELQQQAEKARQDGDMETYRSITERIDTLNRGAAAKSGAATDVFRAETERGLGESAQSIDVNKLNAQLGFDYTRLMTDTGFNYDQLSAQNKQKADDLATEIYKTDIAAANDVFSQKLRADVDLAGLEQSGQLENAKLLADQAYKRASLALDTTQSLQSAVQVWNSMLANATESDRNALLHMWDVWVGDQTRKNEGKFDWGGFAGDVLGAGATLGGAVIGKSGKGDD